MNMTGIDLNLEQMLTKAGWIEVGGCWVWPAEPKVQITRDHAIWIEWKHTIDQNEITAHTLRVSRDQNVTLIWATRVLAATTVLFALTSVWRLVW